MPIFRRLCALALSLILSTPAIAQGVYVVTSTADSGEGSLRDALRAASARTAPATIVIYAEGDIAITSGLTYTGTAPLTLFGNANRIVTGQNVTLLSLPNGADLYLRNLFFEGPGTASIDNRADLGGPAGRGIHVGLRPDQTGTLTVEAQNLRISGVAGHGLHVADCAAERAGACAADGPGSAASVALRLSAVEIFDVGFGRFGAGGLLVEERGPGGISAVLTGSRLADSGGAGLALDEGQEGDVSLRIVGAAVENNGRYCDPARLLDLLPEEPQRDFAQGTFSRSSVPDEITGTADNRCFARDVVLHGDGSVASYRFGINTRNGLDISEAGPGDLRLTLERSGIIGNLARGMSTTETDAGGLHATLIGTFARDNARAAYALSERGPGDVTGALVGAVADGNGGTGYLLSEDGDGDLTVTGYRARSQFNKGGQTGIEATQTGTGAGALTLTLSQIEDGVTAEGVEVTQD